MIRRLFPSCQYRLQLRSAGPQKHSNTRCRLLQWNKRFIFLSSVRALTHGGRNHARSVRCPTVARGPRLGRSFPRNHALAKGRRPRSMDRRRDRQSTQLVRQGHHRGSRRRSSRDHPTMVERSDRRSNHKAQTGEASDVWACKNRSARGTRHRRKQLHQK